LSATRVAAIPIHASSGPRVRDPRPPALVRDEQSNPYRLDHLVGKCARGVDPPGRRTGLPGDARLDRA
jgi:hypothetical protein